TDPTSPVLSGAAREGAAGRGELAATPDAAPREPQREAATPPPATPAPAAAAPEREAAAPTEEPAAERPAPRRVAPPPAPPPDEALARTPQPRPRRRAAPAPPPAAPAADEPRPDAALVKRPVLLQRGSEPYFPPELREQGISGSVLLNIRIGANGRAQQVQVMRSSGYEAFDEAAVAAVGTFLWDPARDASGPAETWITQAVTFRP
ncbi:MAG: energy transducer TonB, partial [Gemmatimonadota bacterium]